MIILVIFLLPMSLMKNILEWVKFLCKSITSQLHNAQRPSCYSKLAKFNQSFPFNYCQKEDMFCLFKRTSGIQKKFTTTAL